MIGDFIGRYCLVLNKVNIISTILTFALLTTTGFSTDHGSEPAKLRVNKVMIKNFVKSLIIPGWGQWSNGDRVRAITFLTAEVAGIYGYQTNYSKGSNEELAFKSFADKHWNFQVWSNSDNGDTACGTYLRTHQMPSYIDGEGVEQPLKDHHFYENISKYPEFVCGWDDIADQWNEEERVYTPNKLDYIEMRTLSNDLYKNAQLAGTLIMLNHLVSAFDAALGTDITQFESTNYSGNFYINPLNANNSIGLEVKF
jgi:hypothetical protein